MKIAVLDDYQNVALSMADWSAVKEQADITVFNEAIGHPDKLVASLADYDVVCVMRERSPMSSYVLERLPKLKLIVSTGPRNASIDTAAAAKHGIEVLHTGYLPTPAVELAWALILGAARNLTEEVNSLRSGGWQVSVGGGLYGKTLGILGFGNLGSAVAKVGQAFGMNVITWSKSLTSETAAEVGVEAVSKEQLFAQSDYLSVHLVLNDSTAGMVGINELNLMKRTAWLINTSRGPIVDETALIKVLEGRGIGGAALDVFDVEPLPADHPYRSLPNVLATPHVGYISRDQYEVFYGDTVKNILAWLSAR